MNAQGKQALIKVAEWLEAGAPHVVTTDGNAIVEFNMLYGGEPSEDDSGNCGTACCIAGAVVQFENLMKPEDDGSFPFFTQDIDEVEDGEEPTVGAGEIAKDFLGITEEEARKLFLPFDEFEHEHSSEFSYPKRAAAVLRHFIETGKVNWDKFDEEGK